MTEICTQLGQSLPTRSRQDTPQTQDEIGRLYGKFSIVCANQADLLPDLSPRAGVRRIS